MSLLRPSVLAACLLAVAGCGPGAKAPASADASAGAVATPAVDAAPALGAAESTEAGAPAPTASPGQFRIVSVLLGKSVAEDNLVLSGREHFAARDPIYASVLSVGASQGLRLSAKWLAPDGRTIAETEQALVPTANTVTTFKISNPQPWPAGKYRLLIARDGRVEHTSAFEIR